jgi:hypothetical protein
MWLIYSTGSRTIFLSCFHKKLFKSTYFSTFYTIMERAETTTCLSWTPSFDILLLLTLVHDLCIGGTLPLNKKYIMLKFKSIITSLLMVNRRVANCCAKCEVSTYSIPYAKFPPRPTHMPRGACYYKLCLIHKPGNMATTAWALYHSSFSASRVGHCCTGTCALVL